MPFAPDTPFDVIAVGEVLVDFVAPDVEHLTNAISFVRTAGGAPANVAVAVAKLAGRSALISAVGTDPFGEYLKEVLDMNRVDLSGVRSVPQRTTLAFVARNRGGIPDFIFYRGADAGLSPEHIPEDLLRRAICVHLSSMALMTEPSHSATFEAARMAHRSGALVSVDPNLRPSSWPSLRQAVETIGPLLETADILKVNDEEARLFSGKGTIPETLDVLGRHDCLLVVTLGGEGCVWRWRGDTGEVTAPKVEVADTTGAGDAFVGALLAELSRRGYRRDTFHELDSADLDDILQFACTAAAISCTQPGAMASLPTRREVEERLS